MANSPRYVGFIDPPYNVTLTDDTGAALNLTGCTSASFTLSFMSASSGIVKAGTGTWTIPSATTGQASYQYSAADVASAGTWLIYVTVKLPSEPGPREFDPDTMIINAGTVGAGVAPSGTQASVNVPVVTTTANYTLLGSDDIVLCGQSSPITITLPNPSGMTGRTVTIKDKGAALNNNITVSPASGTIDGAASKIINANYGLMNLVTDGTNWFLLNNGPLPNPLAGYDGEIATTSSSAGVANTVYFVGWTLYAADTLTGFRFRFANGGAGFYDLGVYDATGTNSGPGALLAHVAATATSIATVTGTVTPALIGGNKPLAAGNYWLAFWISNATDTFNKQTASGNMAVIQSGTTGAGPLPALASSLTGLGNAALKPIIIALLQGGWA